MTYKQLIYWKSVKQLSFYLIVLRYASSDQVCVLFIIHNFSAVKF